MSMINIPSLRHPLLTLVLIMAILTGWAGSPSAKFYQLNALASGDSVTGGDSLEQRLKIAIGPVRLPDYLDRPQIVTRSGNNELKVSEFNRWAGALEADVSRVLIEDVSILLPRDRFSVGLWTPYQESRQTEAYRVEVLVDRFEGTPGESLMLKATWEVLGNDRRSLLKRRSWIREPINGKGHDALVAAMSSAVERLSRDIANGIGSVFR